MANFSLQKFDTAALYRALDTQRIERGLSWNGVAKELWDLSLELAKERPHDHPFSASTIKNMKEKHQASCQHVLFMLRWLKLPPEYFLEKPSKEATTIALPEVGPDRRLRWSLKRLYEAANAKRRVEQKTWAEAATVIGCTPSQLTGLRTAKFTTGIDLSMRIVQWTDKPSSDFIYAAKW